MEPVHRIVGRAAPLDRSDVDTDQIIPAIWMKRVERSGYGDGLFIEWRRDPYFVLNRPEYKGAVILVSGPNFGCGSSREHAPWALRDYGFRAVVAPAFADIFRLNCLKIGLVPVELSQPVVDSLIGALDEDPSMEITVDVESLVVQSSVTSEVGFSIPASDRARLLAGLDDIGVTLAQEKAIASFEAHRPSWLPTLELAG